MDDHTRRRLLGAGLAALTGMAGCAGGSGDRPASTPTKTATTDAETKGATSTEASATTETPTETADVPPPTASRTLPVPGEYEALRSAVTSGGPPKDGIPSVDDPSFEPVGEVGDRLADGDPVFALEIDGDARAYPQSVLVWHEIANDTVGGVPVSVTYCPLTGTVLGFRRGETTFGTSGDLLNSNLVMYDRGTDSRWPQVLATAVEGTLTGTSLRPVPVAWTSLRRFRERYPDGRVLTRDTGYVRNYDSDPYGSYNPAGGYYSDDRLLFGVRSDDDRLSRKRVVVGARGPDTAPVAVTESALAERGHVAGEEVVFVFDADVGQGRAYRRDTGPVVESVADSTATLADGSTHPAAALPHDRVTAFDAMWFSWAAFYPDTALLARDDE
ncbi:MAG: DUF3179 domain-containing protein [Halolamina sp.]